VAIQPRQSTLVGRTVRANGWSSEEEFAEDHWTELEVVILDVKVAVNNQPLSQMEDDVQLPILTPNSLLLGQPNVLPVLKLEPHHMEDRELRRGKVPQAM